LSLTPDQIEDLSKAANKLNNAELSIEKVFQLFSEWQSNKQKSAKRVAISLGLIVSLLYLVGGDLTSIGWIDDQVADEQSNIFLFSLLLILVGSTFYLFRIRSLDLKVREAKLKVLNYGIKNGEKWVASLDEISDKKQQKLFVLLNKHAKVHKDGAIESYLAIKFYQNELKASFDEFSLWQKLEWGTLIAIVAFSIFALIFTMLGVSFDNIISSFPSCQSCKNN